MRDIRTSEGSTGERSIRNVSVGGRKAVKHPPAQTEEEEDYVEPSRVEVPHRYKPRGPKRFWLYAFVVVVVCAVLGILLSTIFTGATVTIHPRVETITLETIIEAQPNAPVGSLSYKTLSITRSASVSVTAQGIQKVSRAATGVITISNMYASESQRLIANTRFEASDGKMYRIRDSITVPGAKGTGSSMVAGVVTATVYADSPGPDYNKPAGTTFTIPGFKGDPRYTKFSSKSEAPLSGGFIGDEPAVAAADLAAAKTTLQQKLDGEVRAAAVSEIPDGYLAVPGTLEISFTDLVQTPGSDKKATLSQQGSATGVMVRASDLATVIAYKEVDKYQGGPVLLSESSVIEVSLATTSKRSDGTLQLAVKGSGALIWQFDQVALLAALVGKPKAEFQQTVDAFRPAISEAEVSFKPFWKNMFPTEAEKIQITVKTDGGK